MAYVEIVRSKSYKSSLAILPLLPRLASFSRSKRDRSVFGVLGSRIRILCFRRVSIVSRILDRGGRQRVSIESGLGDEQKRRESLLHRTLGTRLVSVFYFFKRFLARSRFWLKRGRDNLQAVYVWLGMCQFPRVSYGVAELIFHHSQGVVGRDDSTRPWDSPSSPLMPFDTRPPIVAVAGQLPDQTSDRGLAKRP
jgi:hypothetical protein